MNDNNITVKPNSSKDPYYQDDSSSKPTGTPAGKSFKKLLEKDSDAREGTGNPKISDDEEVEELVAMAEAEEAPAKKKAVSLFDMSQQGKGAVVPQVPLQTSQDTVIAKTEAPKTGTVQNVLDSDEEETAPQATVMLPKAAPAVKSDTKPAFESIYTMGADSKPKAVPETLGQKPVPQSPASLFSQVSREGSKVAQMGPELQGTFGQVPVKEKKILPTLSHEKKGISHRLTHKD